MTINEQDELFVGGAFGTVDSVTYTDYHFRWNGYSVTALGTGVNASVYNIVVAPDGLLWVTGSFTQAGSLSTIDRMAIWNGSSWVNKHSILSTGKTLDTDVDITNGGTYPDVAGLWRVAIEPSSSTPDLVQGIVKSKHQMDN